MKAGRKQTAPPGTTSFTVELPLMRRVDPSRKGRGGFSLIEIAIALGVISAGMIPLLGLMSVGFSTMKESQSQMQSSIIAQEIIGDAQTAAFDSLETRQYYMDLEGREVAPGDAAFIVDVTVEKGPTSGIVRSQNAARIEVAVSGPAVGGTNVYSSIAANLGL